MFGESLFFFFFNLFLSVLVLHCSVQAFSSCGDQGYSCGEFLIAMASLVEHRLQGVGVLVAVARGLPRSGSVLVVHRFSCPKVCGIFPDQGSN